MSSPKKSSSVTTQKERVVEHIIKGKLTLLQRYWENRDGSLTTKYRARLRQPHHKSYAFISLAAENAEDAKVSALMEWSKRETDISEGRNVGAERRRLKHFIDEFLNVQRGRARDNQITERRTEVIKHHLASLLRFYEEHKNPNLNQLVQLYERGWVEWRRTQRNQKTGNLLSHRFRNNEVNSHKMFFRWCIREGHCSVLPTVEGLKVTRTNAPFPREFYNPLMKVSRENVANARNPRVAWDLMNYRYVILLMNGIGCRVLETRGLRWTDIKERKEGHFIYLSGKGKERTIRLPDRVYGHLMDLYNYKESNCEGYSKEKFPFVFNSYRKQTPSQHYSGEVRRRWMQSAGVPNYGDYELVCFRHKFITEALANGAHSLTVASYCGTSQTMIEQTYSGLVPAQIYDLVFKNTPDDALSRNETPQWLEKLSQ